VLAARRLLLTGRLDTGFGLLAGIDHLEASSAEEAAHLARSALAHREAFRSVAELGRLAAERHRASLAYTRLVSDLELEGALAADMKSNSADST